MVTDNHYRWDFIGLSTDVKPTPSTSSKVSDGSTFYCSDNSKLYVWYKNQWYERTAAGGGGSSVNVVQTTGTSTTDVMSQNAVTSMIYADPSTTRKIQIGNSSSTVSSDGISIGYGSSAGSSSAQECVAIGSGAVINGGRIGSVALGANSGGNITKSGMVDIGSAFTSYGYEGNSNYRLLTGLHDPVNDHDAATKGYVDAHSGGVKTLTSADYNYPVNNPTSVALWLLDAGVYNVGEAGLSVRIDINTTTSEYVGSHFEVIYAGGSNPECSIIRYHPYLKINKVRISDGTSRGEYSVIDTLTSQPIGASASPLSARQGKILNDKFGGMQLVKISQTDYDNLSTKDPNTLYIITGA